MGKSKNNKPPTRMSYLFFIIFLILMALVSLALPLLIRIIIMPVCGYLIIGCLLNLFPGLVKSAPPAPQDKPAPAPDAPATLDAAPDADLPSMPVPDGYLSNGDPFYFDDYNVVKTIRTKVVGVTYRNSDGSSRQENIACCSPGDPLELDYFSYRGSPAFSVSDGSGNQLGNLSAEIAHAIFDLPPDLITYASVKQITGGDSSNYGCNIEILVLRKK